MSLKRFLIRGGVFRLFGFFSAVTLSAMIGCGNLSSGCLRRGAGGEPPVTVNAGLDQIVCPGQSVALDAISDPLQPNATITWTQIAGPSVYLDDTLDPVIDAPDPVTFTAPSTPAIGVQFNLTFQATGAASGYDDGTDTVLVTTRPVDTVDVNTKSSGAAQPGDTVSIDLADTESPDLIPVWVQEASDASRVSLVQPSGSQTATFSAPQITVTTDLHFVALVAVSGCPSPGEGLIRSGALTVPIEVATVELNLPTTIQTGQQYDLYDFTLVNGDPTSPEALAGVDFTLLFFAASPSGGGLPPGVDVSIDQATGMLTVTAGAGQTIEIIARLFGTAGELANNEGDGDTVLIGS